MNYFELFGLPSQFALDGSLLSSQFRELQKRFHPDNFATASERDRLMAVQKAAQINDAYQVLKNPKMCRNSTGVLATDAASTHGQLQQFHIHTYRRQSKPLSAKFVTTDKPRWLNRRDYSQLRIKTGPHSDYRFVVKS